MSKTILRPYQKEASDYVMQSEKCVLAMAPNAGKTEVAIDVIGRYLKANPNAKVLILPHSTNVLLANFFDTDNWDDATTANQEKALKQATRNIDELLYLGSKYNLTQALSFPRSFINYSEGETSSGTVNDKIKTAEALEALKILDNRVDGQDGIALLQSKGIKSQSVEGTSVTFVDSAIDDERDRIMQSSEAYSLLKPWIETMFSRW